MTILPEDHSVEEVTVILRTLFYVGCLTLGETLHHLSGSEVAPYVRSSLHANDYVRLFIDFGSESMEARMCRSIQVTEDAGRHETITWQEQMHNGAWERRSFTRTTVGLITLGHHHDGRHDSIKTVR